MCMHQPSQQLLLRVGYDDDGLHNKRNAEAPKDVYIYILKIGINSIAGKRLLYKGVRRES